MVEREPRKEVIERGELYFLWHPITAGVFSGYGLTTRRGSKDFLVGLLMVDSPKPADPEWLSEVEATFGEYHLVAMTAAGERGIACQMQIEPESLPYLRRYPGEKAAAIKTALRPLLADPPNPVSTDPIDRHYPLPSLPVLHSIRRDYTRRQGTTTPPQGL